MSGLSISLHISNKHSSLSQKHCTDWCITFTVVKKIIPSLETSEIFLKKI